MIIDYFFLVDYNKNQFRIIFTDSGGFMTAEERRKKIIDFLKDSNKPISASVLASRLNVSRQIIVGDIALLRAQGRSINATPRGYVMEEAEELSNLRTIACRHDLALMEKELQICVDHGCKVLNVIVDHPIYGQITGELMLTSRYDISQFVELFKKYEAKSLCELTNDIHLHTVECPDEDSYLRMCEDLKAEGILITKNN